MQKITNKPTLVWELGTDCLPNSDLTYLDLIEFTNYTKPESAIIQVDWFFNSPEVQKKYSETLNQIMKQALDNGYGWVMFDCDLETITECEAQNANN